jgi:DNA-binding NarL/FixJ family response regulator
MTRRKLTPSSVQASELPPLPVDEQTFLYIARKYRLSPQHTKIVDLLLRGLCRKQIVERVEIRASTLTTHFTRIFRRFKVADRFELALLVLAEFQKLVAAKLGNVSLIDDLS